MGTSNERLNFQVGGLQALSQAGNVLTGINQTLELIGRAFDLAATAAKTFIATGSQFEQYNVQLTTLLHSEELAIKRLDELVKFAAATPFEIPGVIETANVLQAYGIYSERALRAVGDMAAGMKMEMKEVGLALGAAATGEMERLKMLGITTATVTAHLGHEIMRGTTEGLQELSHAVMELMEERAAGGMKRASKTLVGIFSMLSDKWISFKRLVSDTGFYQDTINIFRGLLKIVDDMFESGQAQRFANVIGDTLSNAFGEIIQWMGNVLDELIILVGALKAALGHVDVSGEHPVDQALWAAVLMMSGQQKLAHRAMGGALGMLPEDYGRPDPTHGGGWGYRAWQLTHRRSGAGRAYGTGGTPAYGATPWSAPAAGPSWGVTDWGGLGREGGWHRPPHHRYGVRGEGEDAGFYGGAAGGEAQAEQDEQASERQAQRLATHQEYLGAMQSSWGNYYNAVSRMSQAWMHREGKVFKDLYKMSRAYLTSTLQDFIQVLVQRASLKHKEAIADALMAEGSFNYWKVAKNLAAASAYAMLGGTASGMLGQGLGQESPYTDTGGDTPGGTESADGTRVLSRQVGIKTQAVNIYVYLVHHGTTYYGRDGMRDMIDEEIIPAFNEAIETGAVAV